MLTLTGKCCSGVEAVEFIEMLAEVIPEEERDEEFCEQYEATLNRVRYEVAKGIGVAPKVQRANYKRYGTFYNCGECGRTLKINDSFCGNCGTAILWSSPRCLTK